MGYIYLITNNINKKQYVGQTKFDDDRRLKEHLRESSKTRKNLHLYNAIRKYGWENFTFVHLEDNVAEDDLDSRERYYIELYDTYNHGYNNTVGGGGVRGYHHSEETKKKIRAHQNCSYTEERARKISVALKGRPKSSEHKAKLSKWAKERTGDKNPFYGRHHTEDTIQANRLAHQRYKYFAYDLTNNNQIASFNDIDEVVNYIVSHNLSVAKPVSIKYRIYATIEGRQKEAYGYGWSVEKV